jgi:hypothetical protein
MQIDGNFPSHIERRNNKTPIIKESKVDQTAENHLKRSGEVFLEGSTKKFKIFTSSISLGAGFEKFEESIFAIKNAVTQDDPLENYKKAAKQILDLRKK